MKEELISNSQIVLPFNEKQFAPFITSLLGRPQTIEKKFAFPFEVKIDDISDTFKLVEQRINDQNKNSLIQFTVNVSYNDGSSILHENLDDFLNYKEVKPLIPSSIILNWTYLINFPNRETPEKQEIELTFISHASHYSPEFSYKTGDNWFENSLGQTKFKVKHTARSWGTDIESLLDNHLLTYKKEESCFRKWCRKNSEKMATLSFISIFFIGLTGLLITTNLLTKAEKNTVEALLSTKNKISLDEKVNFLINNLFDSIWPNFFISSFMFISILVFLGVFISIAIDKISNYEEPSFIVISKISEQHRNNTIDILNKKWNFYIGTLMGGILAGIIANIIFTTVWTL